MQSFEQHLVRLKEHHLGVGNSIRALEQLRVELPDIEVRELPNVGNPLATVFSSRLVNGRVNEFKCRAVDYHDDGMPFVPYTASLFMTIGGNKVYADPTTFVTVDAVPPSEDVEKSYDDPAQFRETDWKAEMEKAGIPDELIRKVAVNVEAFLLKHCGK